MNKKTEMETWKQEKRREKLGLGVRLERSWVWDREHCAARPELIMPGFKNIVEGKSS